MSIFYGSKVSTFLISLGFIFKDKIGRLISYRDNFYRVFYSMYLFYFNIVGNLLDLFISLYLFLINKVTIVVTVIYNCFTSIFFGFIRFVVSFFKIVTKI